VAVLSVPNAAAEFKTAIAYLESIENQAATIITKYDAVIAANLGDITEEVAANMRAHRSALSNLLSPEAVRGVLTGPLREWALAIGAPEGRGISIQRALFRLQEYFVANSKSLNAREFTLGSVTAGGSNTGTGTIYRLNVDHDDYPLEGGHAEVKTFTCRQDQLQVEVGEEVFEVAGAVSKNDFLAVTGSGPLGSLAALTTRASEAYLNNPSFSQVGGTAPTAGSEVTCVGSDTVTGWTLTTYANAKTSVDVVYRDRVSTPSAQRISVKFTDNNKITQTFSTGKRPQWKQRVPYFVKVAVYRKTSATGNIILTFGGSSRTVALSSLSDDAWNEVVLTLDKRCYHKNFSTDNPVLSVEYASAGASKIVHLDDIVVSEMALVNGRWWAIVGGATPFKRLDSFTFTDTVNATRGKDSYWLHHRSGLCIDPQFGLNGFCLPTVADGTETYTDP